MKTQREIPIVFGFPDVPRFYYVLRRWSKETPDGSSSAVNVVVISHNCPLDRHEVRERLEQLDVGMASEYLLVDVNPCSAIVLDTWERGIEGYMQEHAAPCRCFRNWWHPDECTEVEES